MNNACLYAHEPYFSRYSKHEQLTFVLGGLYLLYCLGKTYFVETPLSPKKEDQCSSN